MLLFLVCQQTYSVAFLIASSFNINTEAFHQNYPEAADGHLERIKKDESGGCAPFVVTIQFNRPGSLVAVGCNDGRIEIWDFVTRRIAKIIVAHSHPVCSISWSRNSRQLLSASTDNTVSIWNVVTGECERIFTFPCPVMKVQFNPRNPAQILVCPLRHPPVLIDVISGRPTILKQEEENDPSVVASYDRRGTHIYTGNSRGKVCIYDTKTLKIVNQFRSISTATNAAIKSIEFSRRGDFFLLSCADRFIRIYNCSDALESSEPEPLQKLRDLVTGSHWRKCCFSGDGEFVCAGSMKQHSIYVWERASGTLFKILHGQKGETLLDVVWHPLRPIVVSVSNSLTKEQISIWAQTQVQNWSAFAPDFKELDENVEYEERESEFDLEDEDKVEDEKTGGYCPTVLIEVTLDRFNPVFWLEFTILLKIQLIVYIDDVEQDIIVDVETVEPVAALLSSDEEQEPEDILMFLSISPEVDNPDELSGGEEQSAIPVEVQKPSGASPTTSKRAKMAEKTAPSQPSQTYNIDLPDAPVDEVHPLVGVPRKHAGSKSASGHGYGGGNKGGELSDAGSFRKGRNRARK
ncbi:unnamed protein product [Taenia asiatica]|uniref:Uncharacterized protein n=1 Tax=Taenia asiatica TaxID=60517 RepID=A0A3P6QFZ5_TAEAS|nr:unnamed protein product [Taenia asiatica]